MIYIMHFIFTLEVQNFNQYRCKFFISNKKRIICVILALNISIIMKILSILSFLSFLSCQNEWKKLPRKSSVASCGQFIHFYTDPCVCFSYNNFSLYTCWLWHYSCRSKYNSLCLWASTKIYVIAYMTQKDLSTVVGSLK